MIPQGRWLGGALLVLGAVLAAPTAGAQTLTDGWNALDTKYTRGGAYKRYREFTKGLEKVDPNDKAHVEAIDLAARVQTYSVYLRNLETQPGAIDKEFKEVERDVEVLTKPRSDEQRQQMQPLAEVYRDRMREHALEVIQFEKARPIHKIHSARILAKVAELGQPQLAETLLQVLKDPNAGVQYYALRGLRTLLSRSRPGQPLLNKDDEAKAAEAVITFIEKRQPPPRAALQEEVDGFRVLRREAIRALAQVHTPAFGDKVRPALVLARFAGGDGRIQPPPRIDERVEAVIGLAGMQWSQDKQLQPDYAASVVAKGVGAFAQAAAAEAEKKSQDERLRPWKVEAARLSEALRALDADSGKNPFVAEVIKHSTPVLRDISRGGKGDAANVTWLTTEQSDSPGAKELFRGAADSVIQPTAPGEGTTEK